MLLTLLASNCLLQHPQKTWQLLAANTDKEEGLQALSNQIPHKVEFYKMQTSTQQSVQQ